MHAIAPVFTALLYLVFPGQAPTGKQAVVETDAGTFVIQLLPDVAPNHVGQFMKSAADGVYTGTIFHNVVRYGIVQGGDPLSRDPGKVAQYGSGGFGTLKAERNAETHTAGAVSAVVLPGKPDSAGTQFVVAVTDQPGLNGQFTVFGRVIDGMEVLQRISAVDADAEGRPRSRVAITSVTIRDAPRDPFAGAGAAELASYRAVLETTKGAITLDFLPDIAPETVRNFLQLASAGVYDETLVHRVVQNFVIQTGSPMHRRPPLTPAQMKLVHNLAPEFSDTPQVPGVVSMARGDDPGSAQTSFFICTGECASLTGKYTAFARVSAGMDVAKSIEAVPVDGEAPREPVTVTRVRIEKK
jgi:peptidyl-prolyl cis-trans isomerase B (cyclophilin B)